jgi:uncharacterized membrane protein
MGFLIFGNVLTRAVFSMRRCNSSGEAYGNVGSGGSPAPPDPSCYKSLLHRETILRMTLNCLRA